MSVLVVGEALIDLILSPDGTVAALAGGGPFNTARAIARLEVPVAFAGGISDDAFGARIAGLLVADGVSTPVPARDGLPTTLAIAELDAGGAATYRFYVEGTAAPQLTPDDVVLDPALRVLAVGTLGLVFEPMAATVEDLVARAGDATLVFVDPNCRASAIRDREAYLARLHRVLARADAVKVSGDDLAYLDPSTPAIEVARGLLSDGVRVVLFTDGGDAVRILSRAGEMLVPVPSVTVVDTVGAGDSFGGAFLAFWETAGHTRADLDDADKVRATVERAVLAAAITCQRPGADPPHLRELAT